MGVLGTEVGDAMGCHRKTSTTPKWANNCKSHLPNCQRDIRIYIARMLQDKVDVLLAITIGRVRGCELNGVTGIGTEM